MADLIDRQTAIETAIEAADKWDGGYSSEREGIIRKFFDKVPAVQPDHNADTSKKVSISCGRENDLISRQAALKKLAVYIHLIDKTMGKGLLADVDCMEAAESVLGEDELPAAQPEIIRCKDCKYRYLDGMIWNCPFGLSGGEDFFCAYGAFCPNCGADMRGDEKK